MKSRTIFALILMSALPCLALADTGLTPIEEAALASQAATHVPAATAAHDLAAPKLAKTVGSPADETAPQSRPITGTTVAALTLAALALTACGLAKNYTDA